MTQPILDPASTNPLSGLTGGMNLSGPAGSVPTHFDSYEAYNTFAKAANDAMYETDIAKLTGINALRVESLEPNVRAVVQQEDSLTLLRSLNREGILGPVHSWMTQTDRGGQPGGFFNTADGAIQSARGDYRRDVIEAKFMMTMASIPHADSVIKLHGAQARARENENRIVQLMTGLNYSLHHADKSVAPLQFDGFHAQVAGYDGGSHLIDVRGASVNDIAKVLMKYKAISKEQGNYGDVTHALMDNFVQTDFDQLLMPQYRVSMGGSANDVQLGAPVPSIRTSLGKVDTMQDIWLENAYNSKPWYAKQGKLTNGAPGQPTVTATGAAGVAGSKFGAGEGGTYYYALAPISAAGVEGLPSAIQAATIPDGGAATIVGTPNADGMTTGWALYRSTRNPATFPTLHDLRLVKRFAATPNGNTTFVDANHDLPGASSIELMNKKPTSIQVLQWLPTTQFPLFPSNQAIIPWAVLWYGSLQLGIKQHHWLMKGYVPENAPWKWK